MSVPFHFWIKFYAHYIINVAMTSRKPALITNFIDSVSVWRKIDERLRDDFDVLSRNKMTNLDIITLSGGIPLADFVECEITGNSVNESVYKIEIVYYFGKNVWGEDEYGRLIRTIDFHKRYIYNDEMQLQRRSDGIGTKLLINQIDCARQFHFNFLMTHAAGGVDYPPDSIWTGYRIWAKYGYVMKKDGRLKFKAWTMKNLLGYQLLVHLYQHEYYKKGEKFKMWKEKGFSWDGYFDLRSGSYSMKCLKYYLAFKQINAVLNWN